MAEAVVRPEERVPGEAPELLPAREVDLGRAAYRGLVSGVVAVFVSAIGMVVAFENRSVVEGLSLSYALLYAIPFVFGFLAAKPPEVLEGFAEPTRGVRNLAAGLITGVLSGTVLSLFVLLVDNFDVRDIFTNVSPDVVEVLLFDRGLGAGIGLIMALTAVVGLLGGGAQLLSGRWRKPVIGALLWVTVFGLLQSVAVQLLSGLNLSEVTSFLYAGGALTYPGTATVAALFFALYWLSERSPKTLRQRVDALPDKDRRKFMIGALVVLLGVLAVLPNVLGVFLSEVAAQAGIFLLMALGLNLVVGFAGLLDLGYVAFFAISAYTTAVLTSPISPAFSPELVFWVALPFVVMAAAVSGIMVGVPVLRMRGDYLAIVTLGFGEIVRILFLSDALAGTFGGARGIRQIPDITIGPIELQGPQDILYLIIALAVLAAYVSYAIQDSRVGRSWMAMREDESVAEAMGVNIVAAKLWAFIMGAVLASFGGAIFATKLGSVFPPSFEVLVSITVLVVVIVGGIGSVPGVMLGAFVLIGLPQILREFDQFRLLLYGALLIFMMLKRPEGFIPSRRRAAELHEEEMAQDAWLRAEQEKQERAETAPATG